ncbi:hypothetical protein [Deinococcus humi]|uniref:Uncharacterized protein n=1 Tax=Deinococcus humi TaxID=662880 RepID=A0A7W8JT60_9DEIO|nr:hypothetical protein [Deinococcus humi]MBB5361346.1 hypothetical protein [Deinococcus humi]GGO19569.1 hypothetical protein GCM10008949_04100 [Deinococcus humi]
MPPRNRRTQTRPVSWTGQPTPDARRAADEYREQTRHLWAQDGDGDWFRVKALADEASKGETNAYSTATLSISQNRGKTWQPVPIIGPVRIEYGLPVRRLAQSRRKRAQQVRRSQR